MNDTKSSNDNIILEDTYINIQRMNIVIAVFMGYVPKQVTAFLSKGKKTVYVHPHNRFTLSEEDFNGKHECYNNSWNWLMPAVERIEALQFKTTITNGQIGGHECVFEFNPIMPFSDKVEKIEVFSIYSKMDAIYHAVYRFAKKYAPDKNTTEDDTKG